MIALVGVAWLELQGLLAAQLEGGLQFQAQAHMRVANRGLSAHQGRCALLSLVT